MRGELYIYKNKNIIDKLKVIKLIMDEKLKKTFSKIVGIKVSAIKPGTSPKNTKKWDTFSSYEFSYGS